MRLPKTASLALAMLFGLVGRLEAAAFTIDEWSLATGVDNLSTGEHNFVGFWTVQNPFQDSHQAAVGVSTAASAYDFAWTSQTGAFRVDVAHTAQDVGGSGLDSFSQGFIWVTTLVDTLVSVDASYTFNTPATYFDVGLRMTVARKDPYEAFFDVAQNGGPFAGYPPSGVLNIHGDTILPAGDTFLLDYTARIRSFGGGTNILGTGSGYMSFTLQAVPEPGTLSLLALAALGCLKRRRSRRRTRAA